MNEAPQKMDDRLRGPPEDPLLAVLRPALKVGAACGGAGFLIGGAAGIVKGTAPFFFATVSMGQTFLLGATFWSVRGMLLGGLPPEQQTPPGLVIASAMSGGLTGSAVGFVTRGRSSAIPGAIMFSLFGCLGQVAYNKISARPQARMEPDKGFWRRMSEKSFSPVSVLSNEEYAEMLREKMLKVDVEISIIEDKIAALREKEQQDADQTLSSVASEK